MTDTVDNSLDVKFDLVLSIFDEWLGRKNSFYWKLSPDKVVSQLVDCAFKHPSTSVYMIAYEDVVEVFNSAKTQKMHGDANRGIEYLKTEILQQGFK